ncbi:MAG: type IV pilus modification protein PilV [Deltaproteobacteria bacterium]|nr:type IV pilus modification protein PilV [Deltaproteobacteria bacterium]
MDMKTSQKGFTLLEVLIAMTILSVGILGIAGLAGTAVKTSGHSQAMSQANNLAQKRLEALLSVDYLNIEVDDSTTPLTELRRDCAQTDATVSRPEFTCTPLTATETIGNRVFRWDYKVTYIDLNGNGTANPSQDGLKRVDLNVYWTDTLWHIEKSVTVTTMRSRG